MSNKKNELHTLQVSSPEELNSVLVDRFGSKGAISRFFAVAVNSSELVVRPFLIEHVGQKEIKHRLITEAVEFLSLPANVIDLEYQIFDSTEEKISGVFVCYPKQVLKEYLSVLDQNKSIPIKIVPSILAGIDSFLSQNKDRQGRFSFFDFSQDHMIYFAVFSNGHCDFMREIPYEHAEEIEHEVIQSLRCACSMSSIKKFDHIYFSGEISNKDHLIKSVKESFCNNVSQGNFTDINMSLRQEDNVIDLNLIKSNTFSLDQRKMINPIVRAGLLVFFLFVLWTGMKVCKMESDIQHLKSINSASDYKYAQDLEQKLKAL